ncbi:MAG: GNAT family N-acetyltransferase [Thomasclavelia sp.]
MNIYKYKIEDLDEIIKLFYQTVHQINIKDYTKEQVDAWAPSTIDYKKWHQSLSNNYCIVVKENNQIIGFGDISNDGYLDHLFVHKDFQNQKVATLICNQLEKIANKKIITTHASITAKPFFLKRGYQVIKEQTVTRNNISLTNFVMQKTLT